MRIREHVTSDKWQVTRTGRPGNRVTCYLSPVAGFTMVEIAICLAIIGIALVAIIGVLPIGINVQKENRQETLVDQDAAVLLENIRNGARGLDDLTNYVVGITNYWAQYNQNGVVQNSGVNGYTYANFTVTTPYSTGSRLTNGANIIGILTTPLFTEEDNGLPISSLINGGISNHVVAWVRSLSGPADEKPPQTNAVIIGGSFSYKVICNNAPASVYVPPLWKAGRYAAGAYVSFVPKGQLGPITYWHVLTGVSPGDPGPTQSSAWVEDSYSAQLAANLHELRLTYLWPLLPNGRLGNGRHTFATTVAGQIVQTNANGRYFYFYQPQQFVAAP